MYLGKGRLASNFSVTPVAWMNNAIREAQHQDEYKTTYKRNFKQAIYSPKLLEPSAQYVAAAKNKA